MMANNFSGDSNCVAVYRFESGALGTDSSGKANDITSATGPDESTGAGGYKEGSCAALFVRANADYLARTDANLSADFPCKNGSTTPKLSICFWSRVITPSSEILRKGYIANNDLSFHVGYSSGRIFRFYVGYSTGSLAETLSFGTAATNNQWYHVGMTFDDSDKSWRIRVWDDTSGALLGADATGTATNNMNVEAGAFNVGQAANGLSALDGYLDELVIFKDILTAGEIDQIRQGIYGSGDKYTAGDDYMWE